MLIDTFNRNISYLRISITDRCDFRCTYCMNEKMQFLPRNQILSLEEILRIAEVFVGLGVKKIRITGGEPLVRKGIVELLSKLSKLEGLDELVMTTNGASLEKLAVPLRESGVSRLNVSIDSLDAQKFKEITRVGDLDKVLRGLEAAKNAGFDRIKLNSVIMKGFNEDEVLDLLHYAISNEFDITYIEEMPLGTIEGHERHLSYMSSDEIENIIKQEFQLKKLIPTNYQSMLSGPARNFELIGKDALKDSHKNSVKASRLGLISPHSHNFCDTCNRVRVTAEGRLLLCLGNEHSLDLRELLRNPNNDAEALSRAIQNAMQLKPAAHDFDVEETKLVRFMNMTGG